MTQSFISDLCRDRTPRTIRRELAESDLRYEAIATVLNMDKQAFLTFVAAVQRASAGAAGPERPARRASASALPEYEDGVVWGAGGPVLRKRGDGAALLRRWAASDAGREPIERYRAMTPEARQREGFDLIANMAARVEPRPDRRELLSPEVRGLYRIWSRATRR